MIIRKAICIAQKKAKEKEEQQKKGGGVVYPKGKVSGLMGVMNLLQSNFNSLQIKLLATSGKMPDSDYEDKIKKAFMQLGIELKE